MKIVGEIYQEERALYGLKDASVLSCRFEGPIDGESPLKECQDYEVVDSFINLRYPGWHATNALYKDDVLGENSRAPFWYCRNLRIEDCKILSVKALRECDKTVLNNVTAESDEFGWRCRDTKIDRLDLVSGYAFFECKDLTLKNFKLKGKYSFQYCENLTIEDSYLDTKDAFWHVRGATVRNSYIKGEYLAWYSDGLTLIDCTIEGTQPFVNCTNLKLINCKMIKTDLSFENCDVEAEVSTHIDSIKNPRSGRIACPSVGEIIFDENAMPPRADIVLSGD